MGEGHRFSWSLRRCVPCLCDLIISYASSRYNLWSFLSTCRMDKLPGDVLWLDWRIWSAILDGMWSFFTALMCSDKRVENDLPVCPISSFVFNVSPSIHVNQIICCSIIKLPNKFQTSFRISDRTFSSCLRRRGSPKGMALLNLGSA